MGRNRQENGKKHIKRVDKSKKLNYICYKYNMMVGIVDDFDYLRKNFHREVSIQRPQF